MVSRGDLQLNVCSTPQEGLVFFTFTKFIFCTSEVYMQMDRGLKPELYPETTTSPNNIKFTVIKWPWRELLKF
jgi:hypothetical protein